MALDSVNTLPALQSASPVTLLVLVSAMALVPFLLLGVTSFLKLSVVFGILRNALGAQQIPSGALSSLLAFVLTLHIMAPVARETYSRIATQVPPKLGGAELSKLLPAIWEAREPLLTFLVAHSRIEERVFFANHQTALGSESQSPAGISCAPNDPPPCLLPNEGFLSLIPAFILSELHAAFTLGFLLFLPFVVIDLVVANLLVGLGLNMVSPVTFTLPLKLLLFVGCDAWFLLCRSLVLSYGG